MKKKLWLMMMGLMFFALWAGEGRPLPYSEEHKVTPAQIVTVRYSLSLPGVTKASPRAALLSFYFSNATGDILAPDGMLSSSRLGAWFYINAQTNWVSGMHSLRAPSGSVKVKVEISPFSGGSKMRVEQMDVTVQDSSIIDYFKYVSFWKYCPWFAIFMMLLVTALHFRFLGRSQPCGEVVPFPRRLLAALTAGVVAGFASWSLGVALARGAPLILDFSFVKDALLIFFVSFLVMGGFRMMENRGGGFVVRHPVAVMAISFLCVHAMVIQLVNGYLQMRMSSDFMDVQRCLQSPNIVVCHPPIFSYWCNHELLLSVLGKIFGPHLQVAQYLNALCCVGLLFPVFKLSEQVSGRRVALFVTFLVGAYPTNYLYSTLLTSEYLCAFFLIWAFFFLVRAEQCGGEWRRSVYWLALSGTSLGLAQITKPFAPVFLVAGLALLLLLTPRIRTRETCRLLAGFLILAVVFLAVSSYVQELYSRIAEPQKVCAAGGNLKQTLVKGLDLEGRGRCSVANARLVKSMSEKETSEYLVKAIKRDFKDYPLLFAEKFDRVHGSEQGIMDWYSVSVKSRMQAIPHWLHRLVGNYYLLFRVLFLLGALGFCLTPLSSRARLAPGAFAATFVSGFMALLLIVEAHGRYRVPMYPFAFLMLAYIDAWLTRDNPVYRRIHDWTLAVWGGIKQTLKKKRKRSHENE